MDSLSQFALGAGVGVAVMGRRTRVWKAALWGGLWGGHAASGGERPAGRDQSEPAERGERDGDQSHRHARLATGGRVKAEPVAVDHGEGQGGGVFG